MDKRPLVVHLVYALDFGGLETLLVHCINHMPVDKYRHAVICITKYTEFAKKITRSGVEVIALNKRPGLDFGVHLTFWRLLRRLRPTILHTYNLAAIEYTFAAMLAGVPIRIHAEHGRDAGDPEGKNKKHNMLRRLLTPLIDCYVPVSGELQRWLKTAIGVPDAKNLLINNGVDTRSFSPRSKQALPVQFDFLHGDEFVIGTVGRVQDVKNHQGLIDAFIQLRQLAPPLAPPLRLVIVGDGPLLPAIRKRVESEGLVDSVWLPGARSDIAELMQRFSVFALSSVAEGTPVTILEAMSTGLPIVATRVGGVPEVVIDDVTGKLVPPSDPIAFARALAAYCLQPQLASGHGVAGRERVEQRYSLSAMVSAYTGLYDVLCQRKLKIGEPVNSCAE